MLAINNINLTILLGTVLPWLIWAFLRWLASEPSCSDSGLRRFRIPTAMRATGLGLVLFGPAGVLFMLWLTTPKPEDWFVVLMVSFFLGGLGPVVGIELWRGAVYVGASGLCGWTIWGKLFRLSWQEVRVVTYSHGMQALRFEGGARPVYVPIYLENWQEFLVEVKRHLPHLTLPSEVRIEPDRLAYESHFQTLYDHGGHIMLAGLVSVGLSALIVPFHMTALLFAAAGGAGLTFFPLLRRLSPKPTRYSATIGDVLQAIGAAFGTFFLIQAWNAHTGHLEGTHQLDGGLLLAVAAQDLGAAIATLGLLVWIGRRCWPRRFLP